jgi:hypothetical protein
MQTPKPLEEMSLTEISTFVSNLETRNEELTGLVTDEMREAGEFGRAQLALEDIGWRPLMGLSDGANSFTLDTLHRASELCRAVATVNPLVERGLKVRTGYIWGSGVSVVPRDFLTGPGRPRTVNLQPELPEGIEETLTSTLAQLELESSAATDGNLFFLVDRKTKDVQRVPFEEVTEGVSQRGNRERLLYIRRTWNDWDLELDFGSDIETEPISHPKASAMGRSWIRADREGDSSRAQFSFKDVWYPTPAGMRALGRGRGAGRIAGDAVDHTKIMVHVPFNRLTGWRWGVPDVLPAVWWTKAYKEYLENCSTLTKAYARFAWKVTSDRSRSVRRTASAMAQAPRNDPATGSPLNVGASAVLGAGQDLSAVGGNTKVDFDAGRPLAAMIAAALDVPLPALTEDPSLGGSGASVSSLDTSTILVMQARQKVMDEMFRQIFKIIGLSVHIRWPDISEEPVHRRLQALDMAIRLGLVSATEARAMVLDAWHNKWSDFPAQVPDFSELPWVVGGGGQGRTPAAKEPSPGESTGNSGETQAQGTGGPGAPGPLKAGNTRSTGGPKQPDPMSRADHELRDEGE